jgi:hypothetical protein
MSAEYTDEQLRMVAFESSPLVDIAESEAMFTLGSVSISRIDARFSVGFRSALHHDSRFRKQRFVFSSGRRACAVIFRRWERGEQGEPDEFLCGWVPEDREAEADQWIKFLNTELRWRLVEKREQEELEAKDGGNGTEH